MTIISLLFVAATFTFHANALAAPVPCAQVSDFLDRYPSLINRESELTSAIYYASVNNSRQLKCTEKIRSDNSNLMFVRCGKYRFHYAIFSDPLSSNEMYTKDGTRLNLDIICRGVNKCFSRKNHSCFHEKRQIGWKTDKSWSYRVQGYNMVVTLKEVLDIRYKLNSFSPSPTF